MVKILLFIVKCRCTKSKPAIIALYEHIGDNIAAEPIISYLKENYQYKLLWAINKNYADIFLFHPQLSGVVKLKSLSEWKHVKQLIKKLHLSINIFDLHLREKRCEQYGYKIKKGNKDIGLHFTQQNLLQSYCAEAGIIQLNSQPFFYRDKQLKVAGLQQPYVVLHTLTNNALKDWHPEKWLQLAHYFISHHYQVIEIGLQSQINLKHPQYSNCTGKKSMQEIAAIINNAIFFVGLDSGFSHLANALQKPGLVLLGDYTSGSVVFNSFVPFSGFYANQKYFMFPGVGAVANISLEEVIQKIEMESDIETFVNAKAVAL